MATHIHAPYLVLEQVMPLFLGLSQENNQERTQWKFYFDDKTRNQIQVVNFRCTQNIVKSKSGFRGDKISGANMSYRNWITVTDNDIIITTIFRVH